MKKKIILMYDFLKELGGLERDMFRQANYLSEKFEPELAFGYVDWKQKDFLLGELGLNKGIGVKQVGKIGGETLQLVRELLFPAKFSGKADLIISHSFMASRLAYEKFKRDGTPYVVRIHHPPNFLYGRSWEWVNNVPRFFAYALGLVVGPILKNSDKRAVRNAKELVVSSEFTARRMKQIYGIDAKIVWAPLTDEFKKIDEKMARKILDRRGIAKKFVLMHGRMIKDKRPDWGVLAFKEVASKMKNVDFVISGTIEDEGKIKSLVSKLGIGERVKILGRVSKEELVALYNCASCFLMPAPKEDFGLTPIEAMAGGCPVVAWADGAGPSETVLDGETGILVEPYDLKKYGAAIENVLSGKWDGKRIAKSVEKYREKEVKKKFVGIVEDVLEER